MPWSPSEAKSKTKKANTPKKQEVWSKVANEARKRTGSDASGIREANAVVARMKRSK